MDDDSENEMEINYYLYKSLKESFENELNKLFDNIAKKYGEEYFFNQEDLMKFYKEHKLEFRYHKTAKQEHKPEVEIPDELRCKGRIWSCGYMECNQYGDRCQRKIMDNTEFCRQHNDHLVHGRFDEEPSMIVKGFFLKQNDKSYYNN
jgi:hypothetical protein